MNFLKNLNEKEAKELLEKEKDNEDFIILDVRTKGEFEQQKIEGAINIDLYKTNFVDQINKLNKTKTYLIYCRSGARSNSAIKIMQEQEFEKIYHLKNGIMDIK